METNKFKLIRVSVHELVKKQKITKLESALKEDIQWGLHEK